jgi:hypothetical protein
MIQGLIQFLFFSDRRFNRHLFFVQEAEIACHIRAALPDERHHLPDLCASLTPTPLALP